MAAFTDAEIGNFRDVCDVLMELNLQVSVWKKIADFLGDDYIVDFGSIGSLDPADFFDAVTETKVTGFNQGKAFCVFNAARQAQCCAPGVRDGPI